MLMTQLGTSRRRKKSCPPPNGDGSPPEGYSLRVENTLIQATSTYASRRMEENTSRPQRDMDNMAQPRYKADIKQATADPMGTTLVAMESLRGPLAR